MTVEDVKMVNKYSQPRIAAFLSEGRRQYFVVTEHRVLCEIPTLQDALFYTFGSYIQSSISQGNGGDPVFLPRLYNSNSVKLQCILVLKPGISIL